MLKILAAYNHAMKGNLLTALNMLILCMSCSQPSRISLAESQVAVLCTSDETTFEVVEETKTSASSPYFANLFTTEYWPARWTCGQWSKSEGWMYIISDLTISLAYFSIPFMLLLYLRRVKFDLKIKRIVILFGVFITLCGFTHLIDAIIFWEPVYRLSGFVKLLTGIVSIGTATVLGLVIPHMLKFKSPDEVKESEDSLINLKTLVHEMVGIAQIGSWEVDVKSNRGFASDMVYDILEVDRDTEINVEEGINFYHPDHRATIRKAMKNAIEESMSWDLELKIVTPKGNEKWVRAVGKPIMVKGKVVELKGLFQDIDKEVEQRTKLQKQAEELRVSNTKFKLAKSSGKIGIWDWDLLKNELVWDDQMFDLYGLNKGDFTSEYEAWQRGVHPDDQERAFEEVQEALVTGDFDTRFRVCTASGEIRHLRAFGTVFRDEKGEPTRMLGTNWDITAEAEAEEEIKSINQNLQQRVNKKTTDLERVNEELEAFSYSVSHDLRAPLRAINGFAAALSQDYKGKLDEKADRFLERIALNGVKMGKLIDNLLEFSRMNRKVEDFREVNPNQLIENIMSELFVDYIQCLEVQSIPCILGDEEMLNQVFTNLISNAIKYSSKDQEPHIEICSEEDDTNVVISIADNGVGFDMQYSDKLFEVFHRLHSESDFEGTGVGLALCQKIVKAHHGEIWAESEVGKGATFYLKFIKPISL